MGQIFQQGQAYIKKYIAESVKWSKALIDPGKEEVSVQQAEMSIEELNLILLKLDQLCLSRQNEAVSVMVLEEMGSIIAMIRRVKVETKDPFAGILAVGNQLDIAWLRPKDIGATALLNKDATESCGLNAGTSGGVYGWLKSAAVADTSVVVIPTQTMAQYAGLIHLGAIDPVAVPKYNAITFTLSGIACPRQSMPFNLRKGFGDSDVPLIRYEKPVLVGPLKQQLVTVKPNISGDTKFEMLSLLVARAQDLTL